MISVLTAFAIITIIKLYGMHEAIKNLQDEIDDQEKRIRRMEARL